MLEHLRHYMHDHWSGNTEINELYTTIFIRSFALSMIGIFVPIFLLNLGFKISEIIIFYMIVNYTAFFFANFITAALIKKFGTKHSMMIGIPLVAANIVLLFFLDFFQIPLYVLGIINGFGSSMFWVGVHSDFSKNSGDHGITRKASFMFVLPKVASMIGPLLGGILIFYYGYEVLLIVAVMVFMMSMVPLTRSGDFKQDVKYSFWRIFKLDKKYMMGFMADGAMHITEGFFWPILVWSILENPLDLGIMGTVMQIGLVTMPFLITKLHKRINIKWFMKIGAVLYSVLVFYMQFVGTQTEIMIVSVLLGVIVVMVSMPFYTIGVKHSHSEKLEPAEWVVFRESSMCIGRIIMLLVGLYIFTGPFSATSLAVLSFLFI